MKPIIACRNAAALVLLSVATASAAVLTAVPMGGAMVHANVLYDAANQRLDVHVEPPAPRLTPLDVTNPADNFAVGDPWFDCLDPSARGLAFNRQYGFVMDANTDPVPADMGIWIRLISCSPGLEFYRYRSSAGGKSWDPLFGTSSSTNLFIWNLAMFHPAIAAPPAVGSAAAVFEAIAVDLNNGQLLAAIAPGRFTLEWSLVPSARPRLRLERDLLLCWPASATNYVLESAPACSTTWTPVPTSPVIQEGQCLVPLAPIEFMRLYRLRRSP